MSEREILRHLSWLGASNGKPITDRPGLIGLEVETKPGVWERVWSIAVLDAGRTLQVSTYNTTYPTVSIGSLRFGESPAIPTTPEEGN